MTKEEIFSIISKNVYEVIPELENHPIDLRDQLKDLGANSVDRVEILNMTLEFLSLKIPRVELFGPQDIGELVDLFYEKSQTK